jgi:hypothetical protein
MMAVVTFERSPVALLFSKQIKSDHSNAVGDSTNYAEQAGRKYDYSKY